MPSLRAAENGRRGEFHVKYVAEGAVYLDAGRNAGLSEGINLTVKRVETAEDEAGRPQKSQTMIGQVRVVSVAEVSAVCEIVSQTQDFQRGDIAYVEAEDAEALAQQTLLGGVRKYPQVITFTEGDPLEEEARESVPRPPLPEINRARGRIGFEYGGIQSGGMSSAQSSQVGVVMRADVTRIGGSYWNLSGYWRGRFDSRTSGTGQETLNDLINRTYHMSMSYVNPRSRWVAGFGRLYLPWASSLETIDGGYFGRRLNRTTTAGVFAGTTPDPSSWNYDPNRRIAGTFINFEGGSFEATRYTSTFGVGISTLGWQTDRHFFFMENGIFYKSFLSIYHSLQADEPRIRDAQGVRSNTAGLSRSFLTVRIQATPRVSLDVNHNYFRDFPTFDPRLVSTGLVDKLLFQGLSAGLRVELPRRITVYNSFGRNTKTGDERSSWNQMYGVTVGQIWRTGIRGDVRYSKFDSSFGRGDYTLLSLSRSFRDTLRWEVSAGRQSLTSSFTRDTRYRNLGTTLEWYPGTHFFVDGGFSRQQGNIQDYSQWFMGMGYRFDSFSGKRSREVGP
ncbi:MAG: hypothetical protein ACE145_06285 [Terriglobia bacterium]